MPELPPTPVKNDHPEGETENHSRIHLQLLPTINFEDPEVQVFLKNVNIGANSRENVVRLYYAVRDSIRYDPYTIELSVEGLRASTTIAAGRGWCVSKAILLSALCRAVGIPARLGFADVRNHLSTERMRKLMQSDVFVWHGYSSILLDQKWINDTPTFNLEQGMHIEEGKHPIVIQNNHDHFIANDTFLDENRHIQIITGPNMGGKSTFLRQNAIINIMAQMGSFVPAEKATIGISDRIFSRVGSGDDLSRGQSTFMVEMIETASILNHATEKSFVILDEIGRGTSTWDGLSLAWSIIEKLHNDINCKTLFATHYHELTTLERSLKKLSLKTLEAKEYNDEIIFLYNLVNGSANKSYGLEGAKLAGVPFDVIKRAKDILKSSESDYKINDKLPLFNERKEKEVVNKISKKLNEIVPDSISPIQALEILYELKRLNKNN